MTEGVPKEKEMSLREKAELAISWAKAHIDHPCGDTPEQREYMKQVHIAAVRGALSEPGVRETLLEPEKIFLQLLGVDKEENES